MMAVSKNYDKGRELKQNSSSGHAWVTEEGRGEACRTCQSQISVRHVLADNGYVMLCADCQAIYTDGGRR